MRAVVPKTSQKNHTPWVSVDGIPGQDEGVCTGERVDAASEFN